MSEGRGPFPDLVLAQNRFLNYKLPFDFIVVFFAKPSNLIRRSKYEPDNSILCSRTKRS
jgi:hypothetical protein